MDIAHALVALGGDKGNSVPKIVTPAEILVLQQLHGADSVHDILPARPQERSKASELARLAETYQAKDDEGKRYVQSMFPSATLLPMTLGELDLAEDLFKATSRAQPIRTATVALDQTHGAPGGQAERAAWSNTGFEPIEVPADPDSQSEFVGTMVDPRTQHQNDEPPGVAITATNDGDLGQLKARAADQGTGPGAPAGSQTGARDPLLAGETGTGEKPAAEKHKEVTPGERPAALFE
jgi:hypothetical protein